MGMLAALLQPHEDGSLRPHSSFVHVDRFRVTVFIWGVRLEKSSYCLNVFSVARLPFSWFFGYIQQASLSVPVVSGFLPFRKSLYVSFI